MQKPVSPGKKASAKLEVPKSPDYLVTDGSLVNLADIESNIHQDSAENLADLADNLKRIRSIQ